MTCNAKVYFAVADSDVTKQASPLMKCDKRTQDNAKTKRTQQKKPI